jgi:hypothetical protein
LGLLRIFNDLTCCDEGFFWFGHNTGVVPRCGDEIK